MKISDKCFASPSQPEIASKNDYYPFGMVMPGRTFSATSYRFGFNSQEKDDEIKGNGNSLEFKYRIYDSRLGRFLSIDPLSKSYPMLTPYQFASNTPIWARELEGLEANYTNDGSKTALGPGPQREQEGPLSEVYAKELGYTKYGIVETVKNPEFNKKEIKAFHDWNASEGPKTNCLPIGVGGAELLTGANTGWKTKTGSFNLDSQNAWSLGENLESKGYATEIPTPVRHEVNSIIDNSGSTNNNYNVYLSGPGASRHTLIVTYNSKDILFSLYDQGTGWDKKNVTPKIAQEEFNSVTDRGLWSDTRTWQLFKLEKKEIIFNREGN
jgi:RHS repeat-associated protein